MRSRFDTIVAPELLESIQKGVMLYCYRGVPCAKSPFDLAIYQRLLADLRPATIIEIGTKAGGSALWFSDMSRLVSGQARVISIDHQPDMPDWSDPNIQFIQADATCLREVIADAFWQDLPHPWLIVEDSAHTRSVSSAVLNYFEPMLLPGEYIVIEDGIVRAMPGEKYRSYADGPCRAIADFLDRHSDFEIDRSLCDMFGHNVTYNPGGYLRRRHSRFGPEVPTT